MLEFLSPVFDAMSERMSGPMSARLIIQPIMAGFFAIRSGLKDAREGKPPYFWSLLSNSEHRRDMLRDGWKSIGKVFLLAILLDVIYQIVVSRMVLPIEVVVVAFLLALSDPARHHHAARCLVPSRPVSTAARMVETAGDRGLVGRNSAGSE
jgi:hypothetical protein